MKRKKSTGEISPSNKVRKSISSRSYSAAHEALNDSEMESQMDQFMITDGSDDEKSSDSEASKAQNGALQQESVCSDENKSFASSEDSVGEQRDPEQRVMTDMEEFYNNNYRNHEVHELTNIF